MSPTISEVSALILAGGLGTRLRPAPSGVAKVLAEVGGRPFITWILDDLAAAGARQVVLLTGYQAAQVRQTLGEDYDGMSLIYSEEQAPLGTAGAVRQALALLKADSFLLLNGDSMCRMDLPKLLARHHQRRADVTLTVAEVADASRFGRVEMSAQGRVSRFVEKQDNAGPGWINAGVYALNRGLFQEVLPGVICSLERELLPGWVDTMRMFAVKSQGRFLDIGTPEDYATADSSFRARRKPASAER
jgi:D-glycero-alpha-D-manno-heptose 1-phosphate guanylyltransferase